MSQSEIAKNLDNKKDILNWLIKNNFRDLKSIGIAFNLYYTNKNLLDKIIKENNTKYITDFSNKTEMNKS